MRLTTLSLIQTCLFLVSLRFDHGFDQFDSLDRRLAVRAAVDFFHLLQRIEAVNDFAEDGIFSVQAGRGRKDDEKRGQRGIGVFGSRHREYAANVFVRRTEFSFERANPFIGVMRLVSRAPRAESSLDDEAGDDAMKDRVVVPTRLCEFQKVADVLGRQLWFERDYDIAQ